MSEFDPAAPYSKEIGILFDRFISGDQGRALMEIEFLQSKDKPERQKIIRNRMLRAFEAGFDTAKYGA